MNAMMKKIYFAPVAMTINLGTEVLIATSGGLNVGDSVGNETPTNDNDDNFFTRGQNTIWDSWSD